MFSTYVAYLELDFGEVAQEQWTTGGRTCDRTRALLPNYHLHQLPSRNLWMCSDPASSPSNIIRFANMAGMALRIPTDGPTVILPVLGMTVWFSHNGQPASNTYDDHEPRNIPPNHPTVRQSNEHAVSVPLVRRLHSMLSVSCVEAKMIEETLLHLARIHSSYRRVPQPYP